MRNVVTAILGGGQGTRLWPLTQYRAKPAVPVGGKFRLIDIPISNSLHSDINKVFVITQFNSASLHRHISQTYRFDAFSDGFVNILAAEQSLHSRDWYQGTADAVRQNLERLGEDDPDDILILSGDQLYLMDMDSFVTLHHDNNADLTIAVKPIAAAEAPALGIMRIDEQGRIVEFVEKPKDPEVIKRLSLDAATIKRLNLDAEPGMVLASMGIYVFRNPVLNGLLNGTATVDFGKEVIPEAIKTHKVHAFTHNGYWRDIGTIGTFHEANIELTATIPALNLYDTERPIYTHPRFLPGCKINRCDMEHAIVCGGSIISRSVIRNSVIGVRALIKEGTVIENSYVMGATDFPDRTNNPIPRGVGKNCEIRNAIVDLDTRIGDNVRLVNEAGADEADGDGYCIRDGIIVVHKGAIIPTGTIV